MQIKLKNIANIHFGYYGQTSKKGTIPYLQAKHFNEFGQYINENDYFLEEDAKVTANLLQNDDILFVAKGFRFFATQYKQEFGNAVASSIFFIIRVDATKIIPAYLVSVLNLPKNLLYFQQSASGSSIPSIRKKELLDFSFNLIPIDKQMEIINLQNLFLKDIEISRKIIENKIRLHNQTLNKLIL